MGPKRDFSSAAETNQNRSDGLPAFICWDGFVPKAALMRMFALG